MYDWSGTVPGKAEKGQPTGLILKAGDVISIIATGWIKYGHPDNYWGAPQSSIPTNPRPVPIISLVAKIGNSAYKIGNGVLHKTVPVDGELILLFNDAPGTFSDNSGEFHVDIKIESRYNPDYLEEIK
ncbi:LecA/PA-IL family lectin [Xenorhabdus kozodoii]|uniref:PA-I galactophilic lectin n=1 Tax=Xenorhabdus kozodoii TaxID=351676 RepID=A0A2D0L3Z3_9GAMM|nr:LecA/PA-IL family lectin [Xenorhabdus kozodoii]PHM70399.1 PA-I galactophilic lectin [Xenorhabdus kozodoii]